MTANDFDDQASDGWDASADKQTLSKYNKTAPWISDGVQVDGLKKLTGLTLELYMVMDDIDTYSDVAKENSKLFEELTLRRIHDFHNKKWTYSDGYDVYELPEASTIPTAAERTKKLAIESGKSSISGLKNKMNSEIESAAKQGKLETSVYVYKKHPSDLLKKSLMEDGYKVTVKYQSDRRDGDFWKYTIKWN